MSKTVGELCGLTKESAFRHLSDVPTGAGAEQMNTALQLLGQARALGTPTHRELKGKGLSERGYEKSIARMHGKKKLSDAKTNPILNAAVGGTAGGLLGALASGQDSTVGKVLNTLFGVGIGAGGGALRANMVNKDVLKTLLVLKDRGVLTPELFNRAEPILRDPVSKAN